MRLDVDASVDARVCPLCDFLRSQWLLLECISNAKGGLLVFHV